MGEQSPVPRSHRRRCAGIDDQPDRRRQQLAQFVTILGNERVHGEQGRLRTRVLDEAAELLRESIEAVARRENLLRVRPQRIVRRERVEQLFAVTSQNREQVVALVSHAAGQTGERIDLLRLRNRILALPQLRHFIGGAFEVRDNAGPVPDGADDIAKPQRAAGAHRYGAILHRVKRHAGQGLFVERFHQGQMRGDHAAREEIGTGAPGVLGQVRVGQAGRYLDVVEAHGGDVDAPQNGVGKPRRHGRRGWRRGGCFDRRRRSGEESSHHVRHVFEREQDFGDAFVVPFAKRFAATAAASVCPWRWRCPG
jgi:hypothetical protein